MFRIKYKSPGLKFNRFLGTRESSGLTASELYNFPRREVPPDFEVFLHLTYQQHTSSKGVRWSSVHTVMRKETVFLLCQISMALALLSLGGCYLCLMWYTVMREGIFQLVSLPG